MTAVIFEESRLAVCKKARSDFIIENTIMRSARPSDILTANEAIGIARELAPGLRDRAEICLNQRCAPAQTIQEFKDSGLIRLMQPKPFKGSELGRDVVCDIVQVFATACGSQAWVYHVLADHAWMLGTFPGEAQNEIWKDDVNSLISSSFAPVGKAVPTAGGFLCTGRHSFSSGIDHVDWVTCGAIDQSTNSVIHVIVPKQAGTVIDDWFVNGLEGTGSKSFEINEIFVPAHRTVKFAEALIGRGPGTRVNLSPLYRAPRFGYTSAGFSALMVGMAQGLLSDWLLHTINRKGQAKRETLQFLAGQAASEIDTAELLYSRTVREATQRLNAGEDFAQGGNHQIRCHLTFAVQLVRAAAVRLYQATGASMVYRGNNLERQYRNIMAGAQHMSVDWITGASGYGAHLFEQNIPVEQEKVPA